MELQPVKRYAGASFPTKIEIDAAPETLRAVPRRWQRSTAVCTLLASIGIFAAAQPTSSAAPEAAPVAARIAPLFPYPESLHRIAFDGDFAIPQFISEEEARKIIVEEAARAGITFAPDIRVREKIPMPVKQTKEGNATWTTTRISVTLDGTDSARNISYEFVSNADMEEWSKQGISKFDIGAGTPATLLRDGLSQGMPTGTCAVFYDPADMIGNRPSIDLRRQVQDFLDWLKVEGII